jgi:hypothetical protein
MLVKLLEMNGKNILEKFIELLFSYEKLYLKENGVQFGLQTAIKL